MQEMQETQVQSLGGKDPLGKGMATHCSILANVRFRILLEQSMRLIKHTRTEGRDKKN